MSHATTRVTSMPFARTNWIVFFCTRNLVSDPIQDGDITRWSILGLCTKRRAGPKTTKKPAGKAVLPDKDI